MSHAREGYDARERDGDVVGARVGGWFILGVDDGTLGEIDALADRLTHTQEYIKSKQTIDLERVR